MCQPITRGGGGGRQSWHLSVLYRTIQLFQEFFFKNGLCSNFQRKSNPVPIVFKTIPNQFTSPLRLSKNCSTSFVKMSPIKSPGKKLFANFWRQIYKIFLCSNYPNPWGTSKHFLKVKSQKVGTKGQNTFLQCQAFFKCPDVFNLKIFFFKFLGGPKFHLLCPMFFLSEILIVFPNSKAVFVDCF